MRSVGTAVGEVLVGSPTSSPADKRLIVEIDGGPFNLDRGEDARKQGRWEAAGWTVLRLAADEVYERPMLLLDLASRASVRQGPS